MSDSSLQSIVSLIGHPVAGNPSQFLFERAFSHHDLDWRFLTLDVESDDLPDAVSGMKALGFHGGCLAPPFATEAIARLDRLDPIAEIAGAADAFLRDGDDFVGFFAEAQAVVDLLAREKPLKGGHAIILGGGPFAKAAALLMGSEQAARVSIVNSDVDMPNAFLEAATAAHPETEFDIRFMAEESDPGNASDTDADAEPKKIPTKHSAPDYRILDGLVVPAPHVGFLLNTMTSTAHDEPLPSGHPTQFDLDDLEGTPVFADVGLGTSRKATNNVQPTIQALDILVERVIVIFRTWTGFEPDASVLRDAAEEFFEF